MIRLKDLYFLLKDSGFKILDFLFGIFFALVVAWIFLPSRVDSRCFIKRIDGKMKEDVVSILVHFPISGEFREVCYFGKEESQKIYELLFNSKTAPFVFPEKYKMLIIFCDGSKVRFSEVWFNIVGETFFSKFGYSEELGSIIGPKINENSFELIFR